MKNSLVFAAIVLLFGAVKGQSTSPQVIGNAGTHSTTTNAQVSWTVGELVTETVSSNSNIATQGFHQTLLTVTAIDAPIAAFHVDVFPNPASTALNVRFDGPTSATLQLFDMHGRMVLEGKNDDLQTRTLDVTPLSQGPYVLKVVGDDPSKLQQFKIQVVHTN